MRLVRTNEGVVSVMTTVALLPLKTIGVIGILPVAVLVVAAFSPVEKLKEETERVSRLVQ